MAVNVRHELLSTVAETSYMLEARCTVARVALHRAWVSASQVLLAGTFA